MTGLSCPQCGQGFDAVHTHPTAAPVVKPGELALCAHCGEILVMTPNGNLRLLTETEELALPDGLRQSFQDAAVMAAEVRGMAP